MACAYNSKDKAACQKYFWLTLKGHVLDAIKAIYIQFFANNSLKSQLKHENANQNIGICTSLNFSKFSNITQNFLGDTYA